MRKILKCILALALLSMVFTSNVLAEGSVSTGSVAGTVTDSNGNTVNLEVKEIDTDNISFGTGATVETVAKATALIKGVNENAGNLPIAIKDLPDDAKNVINGVIGKTASDTVVTPFLDIKPVSTATGKVSVNINASLLSGAKKVQALHMKEDGSFEAKPTTFDSTTGKIEFELSSFSPVAFVIHRTDNGGGSGGSSSSNNSTPVVNTAAGEVNHTNYMAYAVVASVIAVGAIVVASKKLGKNVK